MPVIEVCDECGAKIRTCNCYDWEPVDKMRVFRMNDFDWVCAVSEEQAKEWYHNETGVDMKDIQEDFESWGEVSLEDNMWLSESDLPIEELKKPQVIEKRFGEIWIRKTFAWVIEHEKITKPCIISSTEY